MSIMTRHISSTRLIRTYNAATVLRTLYQYGSCSRSQLTKLTGMSPATITRIIAELMSQGIVLEGRTGKSTGGRRPVYVHIDYTKLYIISIKLLRDQRTVAVLDLRGQILHKKDLDPSDLDPEVLIASSIATANDLLKKYKINREHILGVGVAISGVVHHEAGLLVNSVNLGWENVPVAELLDEGLGLPIYVENDANASALAEFWFGHARDSTNSMYIKTETGAGVGLIIGKTLISGPQFLTGEIGHVPLIQNGQPCRCGQKGCLETYVYLGDVLKRYKKAAGSAQTRAKFLSLVSEGEKAALEIVGETAQALALACAGWGILLDLDVITIGGLWGELKQEVVDYCQNYYTAVLDRTGIPREVKITGASFGHDNDLLGAAGLVIDRWFVPYPVPLDR
ncbi:MAG TPA: ROK family transcriptional regulator [Firmicutes bacterium]|nr:ROK family transcriptional regulator [Bacillota bacterium]